MIKIATITSDTDGVTDVSNEEMVREIIIMTMTWIFQTS